MKHFPARALVLGFAAVLATIASEVASREKVIPPPAQAWLASLQAKDLQTRMESAYALPKNLGDSREDIGVLVEALRSPPLGIQPYVAGALGELAKEPDLVIPALVQALRGGAIDVKNQAALALVKFGKPAVPFLVAELEQQISRNGLQGGHVRLALVEIGAPAVGPLLTLLERKHEPKLRQCVVEMLCAMGPPAKSAVLDRLEHPERRIRVDYLAILAKTGANDAQVASKLRSWLRVSDEELAQTTGATLAQLGAVGADELILLLTESSADRQRLALRSLANMPGLGKGQAKKLAPVLIGMVGNAPADLQRRALGMLAALPPFLGADAPMVVPALEKAWKKDDPAWKRPALQGLFAVAVVKRQDAVAVVPIFAQALFDADYAIADEAQRAMDWMGPVAKSGRPILLARLKDSRNEPAQSRAMRNLAIIQTSDDEVVDVLLGLAVQGPLLNRTPARETLAKLSTNTKAADFFLQRLRDKNTQFDTLRDLELAGAPAIGVLVRAYATADPIMKTKIIRSAQEVARNPSILDNRLNGLLLLGLKNADPNIVLRSAQALSVRKMAPEQVVPVLLASLPNAPSYSRAELAKAVARYGPGAKKYLAELPPAFRKLSAYDQSASLRHLAVVNPDLVADAASAWLKQDGTIYSGVQLLSSLGAAAQPQEDLLRNVLLSNSPFDRQDAAQALGVIRAKQPKTEAALERALFDQNLPVREAAATALLRIKPDRSKLQKVITTLANDYYLKRSWSRRADTWSFFVSESYFKSRGFAAIPPRVQLLAYTEIKAGITKDKKNGFIDENPSGGSASPTADSSPAEFAPSVFPWPPWAGYSLHTINRENLGDRRSTLKDVFLKLSAHLAKARFVDNRVHTLSNGSGFAVLTRVQRVNEDGSLFDGAVNDPRADAGDMDGDLLNTLGIFYRGSAGTFRFIAFVVTTAPEIEEAGPAASAEEIQSVFERGARNLEESLEPILYTGHHCHVLIYTFARSPQTGSRMVSIPNAEDRMKQLKAAGLGALAAP